MRSARRQQAMAQAVVALVVMLMSMVVTDAAAVVDVYRMIQYDLRGTPMGSRRAPLNHHATSGLDVAGADLSRAVVILPVLKVNITSLNGRSSVATRSVLVVWTIFSDIAWIRVLRLCG